VTSERRPLRLKVPNGWLPLPVGAFEIGRSAHCQVILDGAKVSRLHARIVVDVSGATIEDLGSSNGVFVNGRRLVRGRHPLQVGDRLLVGEFELELSAGEATLPAAQDGRPSGRPTLVDSLSTAPPGAATSKAHALELLGSVAERAIGTGDASRAELILKARLDEVLTSASKGICDLQSRELAIRLSTMLARALPSPAWLDFAVDLLLSLRDLPSEAELSWLEAATREVTGADARKLQDYTSVIRGLPSSLEKMRALGRLEALLGVVCGRQ